VCVRDQWSFAFREDLAKEIQSEQEEALEQISNERVVRTLYSALAEGDAASVQALVAEDLEWWFHGPPTQQHMMRLLTGVTSCDTFAFEPISVRGIANKVFVEGKGSSSTPGLFWVHIWTVKEKRITQLREYFNTAILVTDLKPAVVKQPSPSQHHQIQHVIPPKNPCVTLWQSQLWKSKEGRSKPGLILTI
jgi:limonene-1,2-epoxide hydrolase